MKSGLESNRTAEYQYDDLGGRIIKLEETLLQIKETNKVFVQKTLEMENLGELKLKMEEVGELNLKMEAAGELKSNMEEVADLKLKLEEVGELKLKMEEVAELKLRMEKVIKKIPFVN